MLELLAKLVDQAATWWMRRRDLQNEARTVSRELEIIARGLGAKPRAVNIVAGYIHEPPSLTPLAGTLMDRLSQWDTELYELVRNLRIVLADYRQETLDFVPAIERRDRKREESEAHWHRLTEVMKAVQRGEPPPDIPTFDGEHLRQLEEMVDALADLRGISHGRALELIEAIQRRLDKVFRIGHQRPPVVTARDPNAIPKGKPPA